MPADRRELKPRGVLCRTAGTWRFSRAATAFARDGGNGPGQRMFAEIEILVPVAFAAFVMSRFERTSMFAYGFQRQSGAAARYTEGLAIGVAMMGIAAVLMIAFGGMRIHGFALSGAQWLIYPFGWLAFMVTVDSVRSICSGAIRSSLLRAGSAFDRQRSSSRCFSASRTPANSARTRSTSGISWHLVSSCALHF